MPPTKRSSGSPHGRFTVSGPYEDDHPVLSVGMGLSCAQTFANRQRKRPEEVTYYVRELGGVLCAMVTKAESGVIYTTVVT